jgi:hypothetical protein
MTMNPVPRKISQEDQQLVDEYLKNGGKINVQEKFKRTEDIAYTGGFYGRKKKTTETKSPDEE